MAHHPPARLPYGKQGGREEGGGKVAMQRRRRRVGRSIYRTQRGRQAYLVSRNACAQYSYDICNMLPVRPPLCAVVGSFNRTSFFVAITGVELASSFVFA